MRIYLFILTFFSVFSASVFSQNYDLGEVTKEELLEKVHPNDTAAVAAILFKKAKTTFKFSTEKGFVSNTEFSIKIKIYKKEGLSWANFEIPYYTGYEGLDDDKVEITKAFTYNLEDGKIQKEKVTSEGKFSEQYNDFWKKKSITFPNVKVGSIIELKYNLRSEDISVLPDFQYQYNIPVNYADYRIEIPSFFLYNAIRIGFIDVEMKEKVEFVSQRYEEKEGYLSIERVLNYNQIATNYTAKNIPSLIDEEYVNTMDNYYARIEHELKTIQYPDEKPKQIANTWENVTKSVYDDKKFGAELEKFDYFLNDVKKLVINATNEQEKATIIFDFLKNRMTWNEKYGYHTKKGVVAAYSERSGNVAEINLILTAMLKMAGLDAKPILISTRNNGIAMFPSRTKFNYVIVGVKIDNAIMLLDATNKNAFLNILPIRDLNGMGRMIEKDGNSSEVDLMPKIISADIVNVIATIKSDGTVEGKLKEQYFDYNAFVFKEKYGSLAEIAQQERIEKKYSGIEVGDYNFINKTELDKPVIESYSFKHSNSVEIIGDKMYFSPLLFFAQTTNPFKQEKREYQIDFAFANEDKYLINITIPEGYRVEILPKSVTIPTTSKLGFLKYLISITDRQIQLSVTLDINSNTLPAEYYDELKAFFAEVVKKETEKIVLKKI